MPRRYASFGGVWGLVKPHFHAEREDLFLFRWRFRIQALQPVTTLGSDYQYFILSMIKEHMLPHW